MSCRGSLLQVHLRQLSPAIGLCFLFGVVGQEHFPQLRYLSSASRKTGWLLVGQEYTGKEHGTCLARYIIRSDGGYCKDPFPHKNVQEEGTDGFSLRNALFEPNCGISGLQMDSHFEAACADSEPYTRPLKIFTKLS